MPYFYAAHQIVDVLSFGQANKYISNFIAMAEDVKNKYVCDGTNKKTTIKRMHIKFQIRMRVVNFPNRENLGLVHLKNMMKKYSKHNRLCFFSSLHLCSFIIIVYTISKLCAVKLMPQINRIWKPNWKWYCFQSKQNKQKPA